MKIIDRYIMSSVTMAFIAGVTMFLVLLCAMDLMRNLIKLITTDGVPALLAIKIVALQVPALLVYAFPMAVLLGILLTFSNMSANSEMVAIRAAGVSFIRIVMPLMFICAAVMALTFYVSNIYAPYASQKSARLAEQVLREIKRQPINFTKYDAQNNPQYLIYSPHIDIANNTMMHPTIIYFRNNMPIARLYAEKATWEDDKWVFFNGSIRFEDPDKPAYELTPLDGDSRLIITSPELKISDSAANLTMPSKDPANFTTDEIRSYLAYLKKQKPSEKIRMEIGKWSTRLAQRYSLPFTCIVFTLIGAALGLRHHRTSGAVGLGISIIVIFIYYFLAIYISTFGDNGTVSPYVAAWTPTVAGTTIGLILVYKANK